MRCGECVVLATTDVHPGAGASSGACASGGVVDRLGVGPRPLRVPFVDHESGGTCGSQYDSQRKRHEFVDHCNPRGNVATPPMAPSCTSAAWSSGPITRSAREPPASPPG